MENPFPGMDPWMEDQWGDAHASLVIQARSQIRPQLPPDLRARVEERVYIQSDEDAPPHRQITPDIRVVEQVRVRDVTSRAPISTGSNGGLAVATPIIISVGDDPVTETSIRIVDRRSGVLVTLIEVLSPANKRAGTGRAKYLAKQQECFDAGASLVEIDLLRGGLWTVYAPEFSVPGPEHVAYRASVWRSSAPLDVEFYGLPLRERLKAIPIPLRTTDTDVFLDLQPLINLAYIEGDYGDTDYDREPVPPLAADDAAWADQLLRAKGLRK